MDCDKYLERMSAALDGELTAEERRDLDSHLAVCPECAELYHKLTDQTAALRELDCQVPADLKARIMNSLPEQETPARKGKLIHWKHWAPVAAAACLVLVVALVPKGRNTTSENYAPRADSPDAAPAASSAAESKTTESDSALAEFSMSGLSTDPAEAPQASEESTSGGSPDYGTISSMPPQTDNTEDGSVNNEVGIDSAHHLFTNPQTIQVRDFFFYTDQAFILSSPYELDGFLTQLTPTWGEDLQPAFAALPETYDQEFFLTKRLLVVLVFGSSGSNRYQLDPYGLRQDSVTVLMTEKGGTLDVAQWCFIAEVDDTFSSGDRLDVVIEPDYN